MRKDKRRFGTARLHTRHRRFHHRRRAFGTGRHQRILSPSDFRGDRLHWARTNHFEPDCEVKLCGRPEMDVATQYGSPLLNERACRAYLRIWGGLWGKARHPLHFPLQFKVDDLSGSTLSPT
jgi:hypothetical protein